jgi:hypothetical protein
MDSLDAQLSLMAITASCAPSWYRHDLVDGSLTVGFAGSPSSYTWPAEDVADLAGRRHDPAAVPAGARSLVDRWRRLRAQLEGDGGPLPDEILLDVDADELRMLFREQRLCVVVEPGR